MIDRSPDGFWRSSLLSEQEWLDHCFGTAARSPGGSFLVLKQIHSDTVWDSNCWRPDAEGDGLVASEPGVAVAVKTADCVPVLLADPRQRVVAAVHAGWKGTVNRIAREAVDWLRSKHNSDPRDIIAAFGPSIGPCCFEIGPDVAPSFKPLFPERKDLDGRTKADLREANFRVLEQAGVRAEKIDMAGAPCTCCGGREFHSWRRDHVNGLRMFSVIAIRQKPTVA